MADLHIEITSKNDELKQKTADLDSKTSELVKKQEELVAKANELAKKTEELEAKTAEINTKTQQLAAKEEQLAVSQKACSDIEAELRKTTQGSDDIAQKAREQGASLTEALDKAKAETTRLEKEKEILAAEKATMIEKLASAENDKTKLNEEKKGLETYKTQLETIKAELEADKIKLTEEKNSLDTDKSQLEKEKTALESDNSKLNEEKQRLEKDKSRLETEKTELEADKSKLNEEKKSLENDKSRLEKEKADLEADKLKLIEEKKSLENDKSRLEKEKAELESQNAALRADLARAKSEYEKLMGQNEKHASEQKSLLGLFGIKPEAEKELNSSVVLQQVTAAKEKLEKEVETNASQRVAMAELHQKQSALEREVHRLREENQQLAKQPAEIYVPPRITHKCLFVFYLNINSDGSGQEDRTPRRCYPRYSSSRLRSRIGCSITRSRTTRDANQACLHPRRALRSTFPATHSRVTPPRSQSQPRPQLPASLPSRPVRPASRWSIASRNAVRISPASLGETYRRDWRVRVGRGVEDDDDRVGRSPRRR